MMDLKEINLEENSKFQRNVYHVIHLHKVRNMQNNAISYLSQYLRRPEGESGYNWERSTWRLKYY